VGLRTNQRTSDSYSGKYKQAYYGTDVKKTVSLLTERRTDNVAPGDNQYFEVNRYRLASAITLSGPAHWNFGYYHEYDNYPLMDSYRHPPPDVFRHGADNGALAAQLLAMTNPSRPTVDLPVFVAELREFPELFKIIGENALKTVAKANLAYWFGWKPLASDLMKICDFSQVVNNRYKELKQLYKTGLSCTRTLDIRSAEYSGPPEYLDTGSTPVVRVSPKITSKTVVTGHCKWKPTTSTPRTDSELISLARRAAFGLTVDPATFWELIPFSWLVDWCSSIGSYLQASRNIVPSIPYDISIMRHMTAYTNFSLVEKPPTADVKLSSHFYEQKLREPASASLEAHLPYLTLRQLSILGSLAVLKNKSPAQWL